MRRSEFEKGVGAKKRRDALSKRGGQQNYDN